MKIGMNLFLWTHHASPALFPVFAELAETGFNLIELPISHYTRDEIKALDSELRHHRMSRSLATKLDASCNPISPDRDIRAAALKKLRNDIDMAAAFGAEALIGPIHSAHKQFSGTGPTAEELKYCADVLHEAGDYAAQSGIDLCVEFLNRFECYFLNTCQQASELVRAIGLDNVGVLYDTHHAQLEENHQGMAIARHAATINHIHISESHRGTPGTGTVNWPSVFEAINSSGYDGRVVIEAFGTSNADIANAVNIWRNCFSSEQEVYQDGFRLITEALQTGQ